MDRINNAFALAMSAPKKERERRIGRDGTRRPNSADAEPIGQKQRMANANKEEQEKAQRGLGGDAG